MGDIISAVDGEKVANSRQLARYVRQKEEGETVTVELYRNGGIESFPVTIAERERPVLDLAEGYRFFGTLDDMPDQDIVIRTPGLHLDGESLEAMREAMKGLEERFGSEEWQERLKRFRELDLGAIQERMEGVEKRLQELEKELEESGAKRF